LNIINASDHEQQELCWPLSQVFNSLR